MDDIAARYARTSEAFADTVAAVPTDRWDASTPCDDWTAIDLVGHVVDSHGQFLGFVDRALDPMPPVGKDPVAAFAVARTQVLADLQDPGRAGETYDGYFGTRTFAWAVDRFLSFDLVVHRWDLARATGLDEAIPPDEHARIEAAVAAWGDTARAPGVFGPEVEAPPDADPRTRVLALLGRRA